ncbi:MAG: DUF1828 domain-containing protein [Bryobacterales bacterium]|nr:DUF1828 domain-containing protein [Bryobacterales bacterium]
MTGLDLLKRQFNGHVAFRERRPGVLQVMAPLFHEDGDMVDIFLDEPVNGSGKIRIGDHGMTLMRLTYTYDLDTVNKQRIFSRILSENRIQEQDGRLFIDAEPERLYPVLLQFAQTVAKVSSMQYYKREVIQSLFYEQLDEFVEEKLAAYNPRRKTLPIPDHDEYEVDYQFDVGARPLFLFGVKDSDKARLAAISCQQFQLQQIPFKGVMVHQDFEGGITKKDRMRITSASDKQFPSLDDFRENGLRFFERERAA